MEEGLGKTTVDKAGSPNWGAELHLCLTARSFWSKLLLISEHVEGLAKFEAAGAASDFHSCKAFSLSSDRPVS